MSRNEEDNNILDASINDLIDCYLLELKNSLINELSLEGFDSYSGLEFIDKNEKLKEAFSSVKELTNNGELIDDCVVYYYTDGFSEFNYLRSRLFLSITYYLHSKYLLDNDKGKQKVLKYMSLALNNIGRFSGASEFKALNVELYRYYDEMKENATKGGNTSKKRFIPTKKKVIELIENEKPKAGWKDNEEFIELMGDKLIQFNRSNGRIMSEGNMLKTVMKWLGSDEMVAPVFSANSIS